MVRFSPHQRHHVRNRAQRRQFAVHFQQLGGVTALQRRAELEGNPRAAQILERAFIVRTLGVHNGDGLRQSVARQMVVGNNKVKVQFLGAAGLLHGRDAVVHGNHELEALACQRFQRRPGQTVAGAAGRQLAAHVRALTGETFVQNGGGRNAVHVIITVDDGQFLVLNGLLNAGHGLVHILEQERVTQRLAMTQQLLCGGGVGAAAGGQNPAQQYAAPGPSQCGFRSGSPFFSCHAG